MKTTIIGANLDYIRSTTTSVAASCIKVAIIRTNINTSSNNYTSINKITKKVTTNFVYNRESDIGSI
jgi:hypothetical protein